MLNMKKTAIAAAIASGAVIAGPVSAAAIVSMTITDGEFFMNQGVGAGDPPYVFGDATTTNLISGYQGSGGAGVSGTECDATSPMCFQFFSSSVNTYTAASNIGDSSTPAGTITGGPVTTGDITGNVMTLDVSSWFANWNGTDFSQGYTEAGDAVTASTDWTNSADFIGQGLPQGGSASCTGTTCTFNNLRWEAYISGGAFDGKTGFWSLDGTATVVPVPAAVWLFGSGLLGLVGIARRRKVV